MATLRDFERRLERIVEGFFTKAFRSGLQPVELAKRLLREMEAGKTVGVRDVWVPNRYTLALSPDDRAHFGGMEQALARELAQVVLDGARERGWGLVAAPEVLFETEEGLKRGDLRVEAELTEDTGEAPPGLGPLPGHAALVLLEDGKASKHYALDGEVAVIGRLAGCDVELTDPGASRRHAEVRRQDEGYVLHDLGSTNGTLVNEHPAGEHPLADGDRITIGRTVLEFRRG